VMVPRVHVADVMMRAVHRCRESDFTWNKQTFEQK
jgi:hypothetical protein